MSRRGVAWSWIGFGIGALLLLAALGWVTQVVESLATQRAQAEAAARHEERLRLGLWRLDSWMAPRLATEAARPYFHYLPRLPSGRSYDAMLEPLPSHESFVLSPLATLDDEYIELHLMVMPDGSVVSPQVAAPAQVGAYAINDKVPEAKAAVAAPGLADPNRRLLDAIGAVVVASSATERIMEAITCQQSLVEEPQAAESLKMQADAPAQIVKEATGLYNDFQKRAQSTTNVQWAAPADNRLDIFAGTAVGVFAPVWIRTADDVMRLCYFRRVQTPSGAVIQGFVTDWPRLRQSLLGEITDVFPSACEADIVPVTNGAATALPGNRMATIPAELVVRVEPLPARGAVERLTLVLAWGAALAAIGAAGLSLRTAQRDAQRRARFAGTVTHELRTPLTTFQLYTDMLSSNMVPPERRDEYLRTLRDESHRLGDLVENVLAYARIEQGRHCGNHERLATAELLARVSPVLERRAEEADVELTIDPVAEAEVARTQLVDAESVGRILFNLVDNAIKYGCGVTGNGIGVVETNGSAENAALAERSRGPIEIRAERREGRLNLVVVDRGPGVPGAVQQRLFRPFERGQDDHTQAQRGIGLGLALSRELARAMGGDLVHETTPGGGATFRLVL